MKGLFSSWQGTSVVRKFFSVFVAFSFILSSVPGYAQTVLNLPVPGAQVGVSEAFKPVMLEGVKVDLTDPFSFNFIVDKGQGALDAQAFAAETRRLVKYFLLGITLSEKDIWVNLSPYEKDRITTEKLGQTEMGRDLLAQDYILKQLTATLVNPETTLGKEFWTRVQTKMRETYGDVDLPMDAFNKIWITPGKVSLFEKNGAVYVLENHLQVLTEQDYLASASNKEGDAALIPENERQMNAASSEAVRTVLIPELEREVNEGKNFAPLRQVYNALLLAAWYKVKVKNSILNTSFADQAKIAGSQLEDKTIKDQIYAQYLEAFRKGVFEYVKEDIDTQTGEVIPRKYFSGGTKTNYEEKLASGAVSVTSEAAVVPTENKVDVAVQVKPATGVWATPETSVGPLTRDQVEPVFDAVVDKIQKDLESKNALRPGRQLQVAPGWRNFWWALYQKFFKMRALKAQGQGDSLMINDGKNAGNLRPSSMLSPDEKKQWMNLVTYDEVLDMAKGLQAPHATDYMLLDGGAGSAFKKIEGLVKVSFRDRKNPKGSKGTDLPFATKSGVLLSAAEIKMLNLIKTVSAMRAAGNNEPIFYEPILSWDSETVYNELLEKKAFGDETGRTYQEIFDVLDIKVNVEDVVTPNFPSLDAKTDAPIATPSFGSHGSIGVWLLNRMVDRGYKAPKEAKIVSFSNGDGINNILPEPVAQWMIAKKIPAVMIATEKTGVDKKGGQIGVELTKDGKIRVRMLERADAKTNDQLGIFEKGGLAGGYGTPGTQDFNTNVLGINEGLMAEILQAFFDRVLLPKFMTREAAMDELNQIIAPDLIAGDKNGAIQLEGPIGTVFINLSNYFEKDPEAKQILTEKTGDPNARLLALMSTSFDQRSLVFTPIKGLFDYILQALSDYYSLNEEEWALESAKDAQGKTVLLPEFDVADKYDAFKRADRVYEIVGKSVSVVGLELLQLVGDEKSGLVKFPNAALKGNVRIVNNTTYEVDLSTAKADGLSIFKDKKLWLEDVDITVTGENAVKVTRFVDNAGAEKAKDAVVVAGYGGIDFDLGDIDLGIRSEGDEIRYEMDPAVLQQGDFNGLEPMIIKITPITDMPVFLGAKNEAPEMAGVAS